MMEWMDNSSLNQTGVRLVILGERCCNSQCSWSSVVRWSQLFPTYEAVQRIQKMKWVSCPKTVETPSRSSCLALPLRRYPRVSLLTPNRDSR